MYKFPSVHLLSNFLEWRARLRLLGNLAVAIISRLRIPLSSARGHTSQCHGSSQCIGRYRQDRRVNGTLSPRIRMRSAPLVGPVGGLDASKEILVSASEHTDTTS